MIRTVFSQRFRKFDLGLLEASAMLPVLAQGERDLPRRNVVFPCTGIWVHFCRLHDPVPSKGPPSLIFILQGDRDAHMR